MEIFRVIMWNTSRSLLLDQSIVATNLYYVLKRGGPGQNARNFRSGAATIAYLHPNDWGDVEYVTWNTSQIAHVTMDI